MYCLLLRSSVSNPQGKSWVLEGRCVRLNRPKRVRDRDEELLGRTEEKSVPWGEEYPILGPFSQVIKCVAPQNSKISKPWESAILPSAALFPPEMCGLWQFAGTCWGRPGWKSCPVLRGRLPEASPRGWKTGQETGAACTPRICKNKTYFGSTSWQNTQGNNFSKQQKVYSSERDMAKETLFLFFLLAFLRAKAS